jgi:hypothetical protein
LRPLEGFCLAIFLVWQLSHLKGKQKEVCEFLDKANY